MVEAIIIIGVFFGAWTYRLVHHKDRIPCEQFVQNLKDGKRNKNRDKGEHFYHGHGKSSNYDEVKP